MIKLYKFIQTNFHNIKKERIFPELLYLNHVEHK